MARAKKDIISQEAGGLCLITVGGVEFGMRGKMDWRGGVEAR